MILVFLFFIPMISTAGIYADGSNITDWVKNNSRWWSDGQIGESDYISSLQYLVSQGIISIPITEAVATNEIPDSDKTLPITVWMKGEVFGTVTRLSFCDSGGDCIPPSFRTTFDKTEFPLTINDTNYNLDQLNNLSAIKVEIGKPLKLQIRMYENEGTNNIQHVTLYLNQHGNKILNDLTETGITFEKEKATQITDPNNLIEFAIITQSIQGNKDVFEFELKFSKEMNTSDLLFRIWDTRRNSVDLYIPEILTVIATSPSSENGHGDTLQESVTQSNGGEENDQIFSTEIFNQWAGFSNITISDKEFLNHLEIEGQRIPNWIKQYNAKWVHDGKLTQYDLVMALKNLESREILNSYLIS
jgi:hypothetical protein